MNITQVIKDIEHIEISQSDLDKITKGKLKVTGISLDSRKIEKGWIFCAVKGTETDGHKYISKAIENGAVAIVQTEEVDKSINEMVPVIRVTKADLMADVMGKIAGNFYGNPSHEMTMYGITGTNGKTTTACLIKDILENGEKTHIPTGYMGTIGLRYGSVNSHPNLTTPDIFTLEYNLRDMRKCGMEAAAMEVSSHGLAMGRAKGVRFDVAVFTNLTHDHLDYHGTMDEYFRAKQILFKELSENSVAILNQDDLNSISVLREVSKGQIFTYGMSPEADYKISNIKLMGNGSAFTLEISERAMESFNTRNFDFEKKIHIIETNLLAKYNIYNLVAAISAVHQQGISINSFKERLKNLAQVEGRMEAIANKQGINAIVDYAHTVDGMEKVYEFITSVCNEQEVKTGKRPEVYSVFGCAGKRDKTKRPYMGQTAYKFSDYVVLTEEDARDEDPRDIALEIKGNLPDDKISIIPNRKDAIEDAIKRSKKGDFVLILGKGEDDFIDRDNGREFWPSDNQVAKDALKQKRL